MSVLKRRSRMVSFRLSEQEYESLMALCSECGARSLSDLARDAMRRLVGGAETDVQKLHGQMQELDREVRRLARMMGEQSVGRGA
jgi:hypothetical protein